MEQTFKKMVFRPHGAPSPNIPLGARSAGHYRVDRTFFNKPMVKHFVEIFWGVAGRGEFRINGETCLLRPEEILVYLPGMEHHHRAKDEIWEYRWYTMDGPLATDIVAGFGLTAGIYRVGPAPVDLFEQLTRALQDVSPSGEREASARAYRLLARVATGGRPGADNPVIAQALRRIQDHASEPLFGIERLADILKTHRSTLSRRFTEAVGISPSQYLTRLRVQNALALLKQSSLGMAEVARQCGYNDPNYFSRLIRRHTGHPPLSFRRR